MTNLHSYNKIIHPSPRFLMSTTVFTIAASTVLLLLSHHIPVVIIDNFPFHLLFKWISPGYPFEVAALGKLSQFFRLGAVMLLAPIVAWWTMIISSRISRFDLSLSNWTAFPLAISFSFIVYFIIFFNGNRQFGAVDESYPIDLAWRLYNGQTPYLDYITTAPFGYYLAAGFAFHTFGPYWNSLSVLTALCGALCFLWLYWLGRKLDVNSNSSLLISFFIVSNTFMLHSFWWYNPPLVASGSIFILSTMLLIRDSASAESLVTYSASMALLSSQKPNVAGLLILLLVPIALFHRNTFYRVFMATSFAAFFSIAILFFNGIHPCDVLRSYLSVVSRASPSLTSFKDFFFMEYFILSYSIFFTALLLVAISSSVFSNIKAYFNYRRICLLLLSIVVVSMYSMIAHGELKQLDLCLLSTPFLVLGFRHIITPPGKSLNIAAWSLGILICLTIFLGIERYRIEKIGFGAYFEWEVDEGSSDSDFFKHHRSGSRFHELLSSMRVLTSEHPDKSFFFGPRLQFGYAAARIPPPKSLPHFWHPDTFHSRKDEPSIIRSFEKHGFDFLVFAKHDYTYLPSSFLEIIDREYIAYYEFNKSHPDLSVFINIKTSALTSGAD